MTGDRPAAVLLTSRQGTSTTALLADAVVRRGMDVRRPVRDPQPAGSRRPASTAGTAAGLDQRIATVGRYAVHGGLDTAPLRRDGHEREVRAFTERLLAAPGKDLPGAVVVGVGLLHNPDTSRQGWAAVVANTPWFASSYLLGTAGRASDPDGSTNLVPALSPSVRASSEERNGCWS